MAIKIGIWIDKRKAKIVSIKKGAVELKTIASDLEEYHPKGGSGSRTKGGPQDVVQDSKYLERQKHQMTTYFRHLITSLTNVDELVVFGPGMTGRQFAKEIEINHKNLYPKLKGVNKANSMTDNQIKAWVRDFFKASD